MYKDYCEMANSKIENAIQMLNGVFLEKYKNGTFGENEWDNFQVVFANQVDKNVKLAIECLKNAAEILSEKN